MSDQRVTADLPTVSEVPGLAAECWPIRYIEPASDGTFEPSEGGMLAALLPVENDDEIIDVIAWELAQLSQLEGY